MATRRMFSKDITNSDAFCDMPLTTQALYFHLGMNADDEGFLNNPKQIERNIGASDDDMKLLVSKGFIIPFESGVVALKHWYTHNQIRKDRFKPTICTKERNGLYLSEGREYVINAEEILVESSGLQNGNQMTTQGREEEMRIVQDRLGEYMYQLGNESLTEERVHTLMDQYGKNCGFCYSQDIKSSILSLFK